MRMAIVVLFVTFLCTQAEAIKIACPFYFKVSSFMETYFERLEPGACSQRVASTLYCPLGFHFLFIKDFGINKNGTQW